MISSKALNEFRGIYLKHYQTELNDKEAIIIANKFYSLMNLILKK